MKRIDKMLLWIYAYPGRELLVLLALTFTVFAGTLTAVNTLLI